MYNPQITAERIKERAKTLNVSMAQLNEICGLNKNAVSQSGKSQEGMKAKNLFAIAEVLECSVDYLLGRTDDPSVSIDTYVGDNNSGIVQTHNGTAIVSSAQTAKQSEDMVGQFLEMFSELEFDDKLDTMNFVRNRKMKGA